MINIRAGLPPAGVMYTPPATGSATPKNKLKIGPTLEGFLGDTLGGKLQWAHQKERIAEDVRDTFQSVRDGVRAKLSGIRPFSQLGNIPDQLRDWKLELTSKSGKTKILDGQHLFLPDKVSDTTDTSAQVIPKLFRLAYQSGAGEHDTLVPGVQALLDQLREREIKSSYTLLSPSLLYGMPAGAKILQVGSGDNRLEIAKVANQLRFTGRFEGKTVKLGEEILQNPDLKDVLNQLVEEAHRQRTGRRGHGLEKF